MASSSLTAAACSRLPSTFLCRPLLSPLPPIFNFKPKVFNQRGRIISTTTVMASKESADNNPGLHTSLDEATKGYFLQQTMIRVKDPKASLDFYSRILGMSLLKRLDFEELKFTLYFLPFWDMRTHHQLPEIPLSAQVGLLVIKLYLSLHIIGKVNLILKAITMGTQSLVVLDT
ncbi:hypothetical protein ACS0TY_020762 [Phlomoides rotata]